MNEFDPSTAPFRHCAIVGLGLLGGSLAIDLRELFPTLEITGIARRQATLDEADALRAGDAPVFTHLATDLAAIREADLVMLCTPVQTIITQLADIASLLQPGAVVTDVGSTKRMIMNAATLALRAEVTFIGGHPMAGSHHTGLAYARPGLYQGATWALCTPAGTEQAGKRLRALVTAVGACPLLIDADTHDDLVALTSHLPHLVAGALINVVLGNGHGEALQPFIAGGFRDTTRIAAGDPTMWRDIMLTNRDRLLTALTALIDHLEQWRDAVRSGDAPHLEALLRTAQNRRRGIE